MEYHIKKVIPQKEIERLYYKKLLTYDQMCPLLGVSPTTLIKNMRNYGLKPRKYPSWNTGKTCFQDSRILSGENHPRWENKSPYLIDFKLKRRKMIKDKIKCSNCDSPAITLHHINKNTRDNSESNLMPLCRSCHTILHNKERGITVFNYTCLECGKEGVVYHNKNCKRKFCSPSCKAKYYYRTGKYLPNHRHGRRPSLKKTSSSHHIPR